jgi:hypothetical protein
LDAASKFSSATFLNDSEFSILNSQVQSAGRKRSGKYYLASILTDVDEPARTRKLGPEPTYVDIAFAVDLGHAKNRNVQTTTIIEVKLLVLVNYRIRIDTGTEIQSRAEPPITRARRST